MIFLSNKRGKFELADLLGGPPPPQFPCLVGYPEVPMRKTLSVVDLLTVVIFFQSKKVSDGVQSTEDYPSIGK